MKQKQIAYFRVFHEVSRAILSVLDSKEVLGLIVERIVPALDIKAASLRLINEKTNDLELVASHLLSKRYLEKGLPQVDKSIPDVLEGRPVLIMDAQNDPRIQYPKEKVEEACQSRFTARSLGCSDSIPLLQDRSLKKKSNSCPPWVKWPDLPL